MSCFSNSTTLRPFLKVTEFCDISNERWNFAYQSCLLSFSFLKFQEISFFRSKVWAFLSTLFIFSARNFCQSRRSSSQLSVRWRQLRTSGVRNGKLRCFLLFSCVFLLNDRFPCRLGAGRQPFWRGPTKRAAWANWWDPFSSSLFEKQTFLRVLPPQCLENAFKRVKESSGQKNYLVTASYIEVGALGRDEKFHRWKSSSSPFRSTRMKLWTSWIHTGRTWPLSTIPDSACEFEREVFCSAD